MILIVDDDPAVRHSLQFSLEVEGFAVRAYSDAAALLDDFDLPQRGCLVIDYKLPDLCGLDLLSKLRGRDVSLPAILITTNPSMSVRNRARSAGVPLVEKPLLNEDLFQCIRNALAKTNSAKG